MNAAHDIDNIGAKIQCHVGASVQCVCTHPLSLPKHHCHKCGGVFCEACSTKRFPLLEQGYSDPARVCECCYTVLTKNNINSS